MTSPSFSTGCPAPLHGTPDHGSGHRPRAAWSACPGRACLLLDECLPGRRVTPARKLEDRRYRVSTRNLAHFRDTAITVELMRPVSRAAKAQPNQSATHVYGRPITNDFGHKWRNRATSRRAKTPVDLYVSNSQAESRGFESHHALRPFLASCPPPLSVRDALNREFLDPA